MTLSHVDKRIKNARLALQRGLDAGSPPERIAKLQHEVDRAEAFKARLKVTGR